MSLIVAALAVARVTRFLVEDRIGSGYRQWVVKKWGSGSVLTYFVHCPWCMSIYVATLIMPIAAVWPNRWVIGLFSIPAASMVAGLLVDRGK